jgi:hypothetical protein
MKKARLFHYTVGVFLPDIVNDGEIRAGPLARDGTSWDPSGGEYVWLSTCTGWENSAVKSVMDGDRRINLTKEQLQADWGGLFRIEVSDQLEVLDWKEFVARATLPDSVATMLANRGREKGANPEEWFVSLGSISRENWIALEAWDAESDAWVPIELGPA